MVAIVSGNSLGLSGSSASVLGAGGQLGTVATGLGPDAGYVNAQTGNLILTRQDELLVGVGPDLGIVRTYNSRGLLDFDNNDNWQLSLYRKLSGLSGTVNNAGSSITRTGADGAQLVYSYDSSSGNPTSGRYVNRDGSGSADTLSWNSATGRWTWTDGDSRTTETYEAGLVTGEWRIKTVQDPDLNTLTYSYDTAGLIADVTNANNERTKLTYNDYKQLTQIEVIDSSNVATLRVRYGYDAASNAGRLSTVTTDLLLDSGNSITDAKTYVTTYTYEGASDRITSISNSDGSTTRFSYYATGTYAGYINTVTDGTGNVTTFAYGTNATATTNSTTITDAAGQVTTLTYITSGNGTGQLSRVQGPAASGQDIRQDIQYTYNARGDVLQMTDSRGKVTTYSYDANGNSVRQQDPAGNVIERSYSSANQLLTETVYAVADPDGSGTATASIPQTTRYLYDAENHLRFQISPEGRVTEYTYNAVGQRTSTLQYSAASFNPASLASWSQDFSTGTDGLTPTALPSGFSWVNNALLITSTRQADTASTNVSGPNHALGTTFSAEFTTPAVFSTSLLNIGIDAGDSVANSRRHRVILNNNALEANLFIGSNRSTSTLGYLSTNTTYVLEATTEANGDSTLYIYQKGQYRSSGYVSRFSLGSAPSARLVIEAYSGGWAASGANGSTNTIVVDNLSAQMQLTESDLAGWASSLDKTRLQRTDYDYDLRGQLSRTTQYSAIDSTGAGIADGSQSITQYTYDAAGNLVQRIDARGVASTDSTNTAHATDYITNYVYDGLNRLQTTSQSDATGVFKTTSTTVYGTTGGQSASPQVTTTLANGLTTVNVYDRAGRLVSTAQTTNSGAAGALGTTSYLYDTLGQLRQTTNPLGQKTYYLYDSLGRQVGEIDPEGALTETVYNGNGQVMRTMRYANAVTATLNDSTALTITLASTGVRPAADTPNDRITRRLYDAAGRLTKAIDALGAVTLYTYDGASRLVGTLAYSTRLSADQQSALAAITGEIAVTDANATVAGVSATDRATRNLYDNDGLLIGSLDAEGYLTEYRYDAAGRETSTIRYATQTASANWAAGTFATLKANATSVSADTERHQTTTSFYNAQNQRTGTIDPENYLTAYGYDLAGNLTSTIRYATQVEATGSASVLPQPLTSNEDRSELAVYDHNNRLISTETRYRNQTAGIVTAYSYDQVGNLIKTVKAVGVAAEARTQQQRYDALGRLTQILSGEGAVALASATQDKIEEIWNSYGTRYVYDNAGRRIAEITPNGTDGAGNKTRLYYDNDGRLTHRINALGEVTEYQYSRFDQVTTERRYNTRIDTTKLALNGGKSSDLDSLDLGVSYSETKTGFDRAGRATSLTDALGFATTISYTAFSQVESQVEPINADTTTTTNYSYDRRGLLKTTTADAGGLNISTTVNAYDAFGRATQTTDGRNNIRRTSYDRLGRQVATSLDNSNVATQTTYDAFDRVLTTRDGRGRAGNYDTTRYQYDSATRSMTITTAEGIVMVTTRNRHGETVSIQDGRGNVTRYDYNRDGQLLKTTQAALTTSQIVTQTAYDKAGHVFTTTDARGMVTRYTYDAADRVLSQVVDDGGFNLTTHYRFDAQGRINWTQDANGVWTRSQYDAKGQVTAVIVNPKQGPDWVSGADDNPTGLALQTSYTYDARGKTLTVTEGVGSAQPRTTEYVYDKLGRRIEEIRDPGTGKLNLTTRYTYSGNDDVLSKIDALGNVTRYTYDADNRLIHTVDALGNVTENTYDASGNVIKTTQYDKAIILTGLALGIPPATVTPLLQANSALDQTTHYVYDRDGRLTYSIDASKAVTRLEYDAAGNVVKRTRYAIPLSSLPNAGADPTVTLSANDQVEQTVYNALNRAIYSVDANKTVTAYQYTANGAVFDSTRYANALQGTLDTNGSISFIAAGSTAPSSGAYVVTNAGGDQRSRTTYDKAHRPTFTIDAMGGVTQFGYDSLGNVTQITRYAKAMVGNPDAGTPPTIIDKLPGSGAYVLKDAADSVTQQVFDDAGRKIEAIDALGNSTKTDYNAVGDIVKVTDAKGNAGYFYHDALGRVTLQVNPDGAAVETSYDAFGQVTSTKRYATRITATLSTSSRPTLTQDAADQQQTVHYDKLQRRDEIRTWWGPGSTDYYTETFVYDAFGNIKSAKARNNAVTSYTYDLQNRQLTETLPIQSRNASNALTDVVNRTTYDAFGNVATRTEAAGLPEQRITTYVYDKVNRQQSESVNVGTTYNPVTNATQANTLATKTRTYDARGNLTTEKDARGNKTTYYYDAQDRRIGMVDAFNVYTVYRYDPLGNKISQTVYANNVSTPVVGTIPSVTLDAANDRTTFYTYDKVGRQTGTEIKTITTGLYNTEVGGSPYEISSGSITTSTVYDGLGNVIKSIDANNMAVIDTAKRLSTRTWYNNAGQSVAQVDAAGYLTTWTRDAFGNITLESRYARKPNEAATDTTTLAQLTAAILTDDTNDRITQVSFDQLNRVKSESTLYVVSGKVDTTNGSLTTTKASATTRYQYDGLNNVIQKTDATDAVTDWEFDKLGRQTAQINPQFTDFQGDLVFPKIEQEYDGLGNVIREIKHNKAEMDDHVTTYSYTVNGTLAAGGRLVAQTDASGARTEYQYDAQGNITKKTLINRQTAEQQAASQYGTDDVTLYWYDSMNRQVKSKDLGTGLINEVQYNDFNQISAKRSYLINSQAPYVPNFWTEFAEYDQAGRVWKTNSGDGVTKVSVYDRNGNATLILSGTLDMKNMTLEHVLHQKAIDQAAKSAYDEELDVSGKAFEAELAARAAAYKKAISLGQSETMAKYGSIDTAFAISSGIVQQTLYTFTAYDAKNQVVNIIQPSMQSIRDVIVVQGTYAGAVFAAPTAGKTELGSISGALGSNPVTGGTETFITETIGKTTMTTSGGSFIGTYNNNRVVSTVKQNVSITIDPGFIGTITIIVSLTNQVSGYLGINRNYYLPISNTDSELKTITNSGTVNFSLSSSLDKYLGGPYNTQLSVSYSIQFNGQNFSENNYYSGGSLVKTDGTTTVQEIISGPRTYNYLFLNGLPNTTDKVVFIARGGAVHTASPVGNNVGMFEVKPLGMYESKLVFSEGMIFEYLALDKNGNLLMQKKGRIAGNTITEIPIESGNAGRAFILASPSYYGYVSPYITFIDKRNNFQLLNQPEAAKSISLRYRIKGSSDAWSTPNWLTYQMPGWFGLDTSKLGLKSNTTYEISLNLLDANRVSISQSHTEFTVTNAFQQHHITVGEINVDPLVRFTQPIKAQYLDVKYRVAGSMGAYSAVNRLSPTKAGSGLFDFTIYGFGAGTFDFDIQGYDSQGFVISHSQIIVALGAAGSVNVTSVNPLPIPQMLSLKPQQYDGTSDQYLKLDQLSYRLKGSNDDYSPLSAYYSNNQFRAQIPASLAPADYEYRYTTYRSNFENPASYTTLFAEDFNSLMQQFTLPATGISAGGPVAENGTLNLNSTTAEEEVHQGASSPTFDYEEGMILRAEISPDGGGGRGSFGLEGIDSAGNYRRQMIEFRNGNLYSDEYYASNDFDNTKLTMDDVDPTYTYVVEFLTGKQATTAYFYVKGLERESGWSASFSSTSWKSFHIQAYAYEGPELSDSTLKIDNITLARSLESQVSTGYFTVGSNTTQANELSWAIYNNAADSSTIINRSQQYNAFGEIISETDGNNNVTDLQYNTLGKLIAKRDPQSNITLANGFVLSNNNVNTTLANGYIQEGIRAKTQYSYDLAGRLVATIDANGNLTTQAWLAGAPPEAQDMISFERHADGGIITRQYDVFGNQRIVIDEVKRRTEYQYDNEDRVIDIQRHSGLHDLYSYDSAGQRIRHTNSFYGASVAEKTYYDSLGRITQTSSYEGLATQYSYSFGAVEKVGGGSTFGWIKTTTNADTRTLVDQIDLFNRVTFHQDLSGRQFTYNYNHAGWLTRQTGSNGQHIAYTHYNNGYIQSIHDKATGMYTYYEYDKNGNKTFEGYVSLKDPIDASLGARNYYQYANIDYDAMDRIKTITDPQATIRYEYDAMSNRRMVNSVYHDGLNGAMRTQEYWYTYDQMNRFTTTMGSLATASTGAATATRGNSATDSSVLINKGAAGGAGVAITYNFASERKIATNASTGTTETYSYTADGYLEQVNISDGRSVTRKNDALGRVIEYKEKSANGSDTYSKTSSYNKDNRLLSETGTDGTTTYLYFNGVSNTASSGGAGALAESVNTKNDTTLTTRYTYQYWDEAKQSTVTAQPQNANAPGWQAGYSDMQYDVNGHLIGAIDHTGNRRFTYVSNAQGLVLSRSEMAGSYVNRVHRYYYVDGRRVGDVGNDGPSRMDYVSAMAARGIDKKAYANWKPIASADFDQNYEPISPTYPGATASSYIVRNGDTLQSIASTVWGDSAMWYLIADANGLTSGELLTIGQVLTIPNKVTNIHNNSGTFRPYNAGEVIGDTSPTIPSAPPQPQPQAQSQGKKGGCGGIGGILVAVITVAVAVIAPQFLPAIIQASPVVTAMAAAVGNIAGQLAGNILGAQQGFNFGSLATSMLSAGITQGVLGSASSPTAFGEKLGGLVGGGYAEIAARAVTSNVIGQGVGNLTGQQKGFSWTSVAAAGVGAAAGAYVGDKVGTALGKSGSFINGTTQLTKGAGFVTATTQGMTASLVSQVTQIALDGRGKLNWANVAINGVNAGVGYLAGYNDPKNGGMPKEFGQGKLGNVEAQIANGQRYAANTGGTSTDKLDETVVRATRLPLDEVTETADRLMQLNALNATSKFDREEQAVRNGGLIVKTYTTQAQAAAASGGLVASNEATLLSRDQLKAIYPKASDANIDRYLPLFNKYMPQYEVNTPQRIAAFLGQVGQETGQLSSTSESTYYTNSKSMMQLWPSKFPTEKSTIPYLRNSEKMANYVYGDKNGNLGGADGYDFRGSGILQITGRENFERISTAIGEPLLTSPDLLRTNPDVSVRAALQYWKDRNLNAPADNGKLKDVTRLVNGNGLVGYEQRLSITNNALDVMRQK